MCSRRRTKASTPSTAAGLTDVATEGRTAIVRGGSPPAAHFLRLTIEKLPRTAHRRWQSARCRTWPKRWPRSRIRVEHHVPADSCGLGSPAMSNGHPSPPPDRLTRDHADRPSAELNPKPEFSQARPRQDLSLRPADWKPTALSAALNTKSPRQPGATGRKSSVVPTLRVHLGADIRSTKMPDKSIRPTPPHP